VKGALPDKIPNEMNVTITLITSFSFPGRRDTRFILPEGMKTIGDLLQYLGGELEYSLLKPGEDVIDDDLEVAINGKSLWAFAEGLQTPLSQGDTVEVYMLTLGGG
jgi:hypothetical protein